MRGLQKKQFCILNKQYTKAEYETLVSTIIAAMEKSGEWGEFLPMSLSPFPYNHTPAQRYFPLTEDQAEKFGCSWHNKELENITTAISSTDLPDALPEADTSFVAKSLKTEKAYRITTQELKRYRTLGAPLPRLTYDERMEDRIHKLGDIRLYERKCVKTGKTIWTTYPPETEFPIWEREEYIKAFRG